MDKKYQVFISSTYEDLKEERDQAIKAILEMGHIPVGMEMFSAGDEEQWMLIARQILEADYYVLIIAHRYGSETDDELSYTEKEYDYAVENGVPVLGFIIDDDASWPSSRVDKSDRKKKKIDSFKSKVKKKLVQFWKTKEDLHGKISISLMKAMNTNPRPGWARATESISAEVTKELSRLSAENSKLREEIVKYRKAKEEQLDEVREVVHIMYENKRVVRVRKVAAWEEAVQHRVTLLDIFHSIAPNLLSENSSLEISQNIALSLEGVGYFNNWPLGSNIITILIADFVALDVIEPSKKKHSVNDKNNYWSLTKLGKQVLQRSRRIQLQEGIKTAQQVKLEESDESYPATAADSVPSP